MIVEGVPAIVCDYCGEISIQPDIASELQKTVWDSREPLWKLETSVYEFSRR